MSAAERAQRTTRADALCAEAFTRAGCPETGVAMVAVGGFGRGELAPYSDLDVVLVLDDSLEPGPWAADIWYPLWDAAAHLDHSVRTLSEVVDTASRDLRVMLGLLDARHLAGDPNLTLRLRTTLLTQWRRDARARLGELQELVSGRADRLGELAHSAVPDLKESVGGLRDATVLKALVSSWLVDIPHVELERSRSALLDVRDALHDVAGRGTDRVAPELWPDLATRLGFADATAAQRHTRALGRRITHVSRLTWSRAEAALRPASAVRRPHLEPIAPGLALSYGDVVVDAGVAPSRDPLLLLRAAAEAAERGRPLAPATAARLVRECPPLPDPWPSTARDLMVRLLAAGHGLQPVWETLDETGAVAAIVAEWEQIRLLPHASVVHRFTVDRHVIETCIEASGLIRRVARPDLLVVAAFLHDIGKGGAVSHSIAGEGKAHAIALRMGFPEHDAATIATLVRWHLLLPQIATTRDPDDPATTAEITGRIGDRETLDLLMALTEADAKATGDKAWTSWRAGLIGSLYQRAAAALDGPEEPPEPASPRLPVPADLGGEPSRVWVGIESTDHGSRVSIISGDRVGLLADAAAALALARASVHAAHAWTERGFGFSQWEVSDSHLDAVVLRQRLEALASGRLDAAPRLSRPAAAALAPVVTARAGAATNATVLEVRAADRPGLLYTVCAAMARIGVSVRSAHVATVGPQADDVFYIHEPGGGALSTSRARAAEVGVLDALARAQTSSETAPPLPGGG